MSFRLRATIAVLLTLFGFVLIAPLIFPLPPLNTVPATDLADESSQFLEIDGFNIHYKRATLETTGALNLVLIHGFGSSLYTWHEVIDILGQAGQVIAYDRIGYGLSSRPLKKEWQGENPYTPEAQPKIAQELMDEVGFVEAVLIGHAAGAAVALELALEHPEKVTGLILVDAAIYEGSTAPAWVRPLLSTPQFNRLGPLFMRSIAGEPGTLFLRTAWHNPENLSDQTLAAYQQPYQVDNWDKALWEISKASRKPKFAERLNELSVPTLVISGAEDSIVAPELSERLATEIKGADFALFEDCGHIPQEECSTAFADVVLDWLFTSVYKN